jgi:hypothetical protein
MDAIEGHHVKWNKPGSETQTACFLSYMEYGSKRWICTQKQACSYKYSYVEHNCSSETTLWNSGKEEKEKRNDKASTICKT